MVPVSLQRQLQGNGCWGCGPDNPIGLGIESHVEDDEVVCLFTPQPAHNAGPPHVVNGGVLATVIDCHSIAAAAVDVAQRENRALNSEPLIWYVTRSLSIKYLRPTPMGTPIEFRARVTSHGERKSTVVCTVTAAGKRCATAEVVAVRVSASWVRDEPPPRLKPHAKM